jgi:hypothetical protein
MLFDSFGRYPEPRTYFKLAQPLADQRRALKLPLRQTATVRPRSTSTGAEQHRPAGLKREAADPMRHDKIVGRKATFAVCAEGA